MSPLIDDDVRWTTGSVTLSGRVAAASGSPRATVLAIHGGIVQSWYWDNPIDPGASLLRLGSLLGFRVVAVDRPGYGAASGISGDQQTVRAQAALLNELAARLSGEGDAGAGVFLLGHSLSALVTLEMAASEPSYPLLGVAVGSTPTRHSDFESEGLAGRRFEGTHLPLLSREALRESFYGPDGTYDPEALDLLLDRQAPVPLPEFRDLQNWPSSFPAVAARITAPVQYVIAQRESSTIGGPAALLEAPERFSRSRHIEAWQQDFSGHVISLHHVARSYHLRVFAFFEECLATR